jgi:hypothetical protein
MGVQEAHLRDQKEARVKKEEITQKLNVLIPHWISHNEEHAGEYRKWAERLEAEGLVYIAERLRQAAELVVASNRHFQEAQTKLEDVA